MLFPRVGRHQRGQYTAFKGAGMMVYRYTIKAPKGIGVRGGGSKNRNVYLVFNRCLKGFGKN